MKKTILFIEDNVIAQALIAEVFGGEEITICGDYVAAMEKLSQDQYGLVITDIFFPQETGTGKKELSGELAERLRSFCQKKGINDFFEKIVEVLSIKEYIEEDAMNDLSYAFEQSEIEAEEIENVMVCQKRAITGIDSWLSSKDETDQPLGVLIAEECEKRSLKFRMASSLFHHNDKLEAINQFVNSKKWPDVFDYGHKISSGKELENPKEYRIFWEELRKEVMKVKGSA